MDGFFDNLIPRPREMKMPAGSTAPPRRLALTARGLNEGEAGSFPRLWRAAFRDWSGTSGRRLAVDVRLRPGFVPGKKRVPRRLRAESYELRVGRGRAVLTAGEYPGIQRGIQTLKQILENAEDRGTLPDCRIVDWPRIAHRGIHFDLAREMEYRPAHLRKVVEHLAYFKMNTLHLYLENKFVYPSCPRVAPPGVMTPKQARALCRYAALFGIRVIPQISTMGHMEHFLNGPLADLRENPRHSFNLCPSHRRARPLLAGLIADVADAFDPPWIHVGYDESHSGICRRCRRRGEPSDILADHLNWLNGEVKRHGARSMIYGDKFLSRDEFLRADAVNGGPIGQAHAAIRKVDRDIIITNWHYTAPYGGTTRYLVKEGFEVHISSGSNIYWHDSIPLNRGQHWIVDTTDLGIQEGATGAFNTNWEFYRGQFFDNFWFFEGLAAERQWSSHRHSYTDYGRRFSSRFWGVETDYYSDLAGLAEATPIERRRTFLDDSVFCQVHWQGKFDYIDIGDYIVSRARHLRREARRNRDTLRLLDMPGRVIRYIGVRNLQCAAAELAMAEGSGSRLKRALREMKKEANVVAGRLADGYRIYGGAVQDRGRLRAQVAEIDKALKRAGKLSGTVLKRKKTPSSLAAASAN